MYWLVRIILKLYSEIIKRLSTTIDLNLYNKKSSGLVCKGTTAHLSGKRDSAIKECTVQKSCKAVFNHGCDGNQFVACEDVEVHQGLSSGCTYVKSKILILKWNIYT